MVKKAAGTHKWEVICQEASYRILKARNKKQNNLYLEYPYVEYDVHNRGEDRTLNFGQGIWKS